ncbi:MAG: RNA polymerase subunit sigma [Blautia sp.]|nr:RNA polymerase subunit sigma [Blautia sp.]
MGTESDNKAAIEAGKNLKKRNEFLKDSQKYIMRITSRIKNSPITDSDEEWSIALRAVSSALDSYDESKGDFWPYAALVIRSRLTDWYRSSAWEKSEIAVRPEVFDGDVCEEDPDFSLQMEVRGHLGVSEENSLKDEIEALQEELSGYGISFFDLAECSPKAAKTRSACAGLTAALFTPPPPLISKLRKNRSLPIREMLSRFKSSRKLIDRYRKYLITSALILDGDYPGLEEYLGYIRAEINERRQEG